MKKHEWRVEFRDWPDEPWQLCPMPFVSRAAARKEAARYRIGWPPEGETMKIVDGQMAVKPQVIPARGRGNVRVIRQP